MTDDAQISFYLLNLEDQDVLVLEDLAKDSDAHLEGSPGETAPLVFEGIIILVGSVAAVAALLHAWRIRRGGQYIDLTTDPPTSWFSRDLGFELTVIIRPGHEIEIKTDTRKDAWERIVDAIGKLVPSLVGKDKPSILGDLDTANEAKKKVEELVAPAEVRIS